MSSWEYGMRIKTVYVRPNSIKHLNEIVTAIFTYFCSLAFVSHHFITLMMSYIVISNIKINGSTFDFSLMALSQGTGTSCIRPVEPVFEY